MNDRTMQERRRGEKRISRRRKTDMSRGEMKGRGKGVRKKKLGEWDPVKTHNRRR